MKMGLKGPISYDFGQFKSILVNFIAPFVKGALILGFEMVDILFACEKLNLV